MKKSIFLLGLLTTALCLTACDSKDYNMSFEEALETAQHSEFQEILSQNDNFEQNFDIAGNYDAEGNKVEANISSNSKQSLNNKNSESSTKFAANITASGETLKLDGTLDIKLVDDTIYLNIPLLDLTGSENLAMVGMMIEGFKNQWFSIPMTGLNDMPNTFSILKDSKDLNDRAKEIVINKGSVVYSGKFSQFNGYNARKISLDNDKLNEFIKEYYKDYYNTINNELSEEAIQDVPEINIQNFEGYLVITGKDKVTTVIENMDTQDGEILMNINGFAGEDFEMYLSEGEETLISIIAHKKGSKYEVSATADVISLEGTVSPKLSKSSVNLKFDATLRIKSTDESRPETVIPFKGSWGYASISEFTVVAPENAQDLSELLGSYLGGMMGSSDYDEAYDYEDLYGDELEKDIAEAAEVTESAEVTE